jgi:outer membrane protein insertion porin family
MGFYTDVQVDLSEAEGKSVLTFIVTEKASIRSIKFEGNDELDEDDLKAVVDLKEFGILDLAKVTRNAEKLKDLYTEKGYFLAEVNYEVVDLGDNEVDVLFRIVEKQEVKVARITIVGNKALTDTEIKENLETQEGGFLEFLTSAGSFKAEAFERDSMRVNQFYLDKGYITARVGVPKIELSPDKREMYLTIPVEEGERYKTGDIDITGDLRTADPATAELDEGRAARPRAPRKGRVVQQLTLLRDTINNIGELYKDKGYAYVNPTPNTNVDPEAKTVSRPESRDR